MNATFHAESSVHTAEVPPTGALSVLLIEDDASVRRFLEVILQRDGFAVTAVGDGLQAMRQLLASRFDIVITDAVIPYVSGREICRFMRGHSQFTKTPIVLLSGFGQATLDDAGKEADVYLAKPVRPEEFIECIRGLVKAAA